MQSAGFASDWMHRWKDISGKVAIVDGTRSLTYADLHACISAGVQALRAAGLAPGDRVALVLDSSWQYVSSYLAVLATGGIAVPLNPGARERDLVTWIEHSAARIVIAEPGRPALEELQGALPADCRLLTAEPEGVLFAATQTRDAAFFQPAAHSPAAIMFTSGTTGAPKGVLLNHENLRANAFGIIESLALTADDSVMAVLPFTYAYGNSVLLSHLACGGRVVIQRGFGFPHAVVEAMSRERVTGFAGVPSTFALLLSRVRVENYDLSRLRYVTQAGGPMPVATTRRLMEALPGKQIYIMYGQTEATSRLTCLPAHRLADKLGSAGIPLRDVELEIRDAAGAVRAPGEPGDIWARGPNIMAGYWRNEDATAQVLRQGWLRTGDVGHLDAEGFLYIQGRRSDIIKVGAHRVHPQDIEDVLAELPEVAECAVVGVDDEILGEVVKALVVRRAGSALEEQHVKRHCLENLAAYKVPRYVEFVASLPRTSSGKVQRSRLRNPQELN